MNNQKIIILGDSFAELRPDKDYLWQYLLANTFAKDLVNIAKNGASSEWMMLKIAEYLEPNLESSDFLVVIVPFWERVCIWPDHPDLNALFPLESADKDWVTNLDNLPLFISEKLKCYSLEERQAFQQYFQYLKNDELLMTKTAAMLNWINNISYKLNTKPLIIDSHRFVENYSINLSNCSVANGSLFPICEKEFISAKVFEQYTNSGPFNDFRTGHLSECNHKILAEKISTYFLHNEIPDLTMGFHEKIIDGSDTEKKSLLQKITNFIRN